MESSPDSRPKAGLRERKKARTRAEIQRQALRLFRERGYEETTVGRIAEAAEVSESTFFRYFPTKEDVVLWDELDPLVFEAFKKQPPEMGPIRALRESIRDVLSGTSAAEKADLLGRLEVLMSVPPLRAMLLDGLRGPMGLLARAMAERAGRRPDDPVVRALAGAVMGIGLSAMFAAAEPEADVVSLIDEGLAFLEAGFPTLDEGKT
jgi:AcrR family transcriptional regulator